MSPLGPGLAAAAWAAGAGLVTLGIPLLVAWAADSRSGSGAAAATRAVGQLWLLAHGAALSVPGGTVDLTPLGLLLVPLALLHRAGRHAVRGSEAHEVRDCAGLVGAIAFPYALAAGVVAAGSATSQVRPAPVQAVFAGLAVALVGAGSGVVRESGVADRLRASARVVAAASGAVASLAALVAAGAALGGVAFVAHFERASTLSSASGPGFVGGVTLLLGGVLCVPNAALWGSTWLAGPGFAVGTGTSVAPFATTVGALPAFPLLAALPASPVPTWVGVLALLVPVAAGVVGGVRYARGTGGAAWWATVIGPATGAAMAAAAWLSGGSLGGARLTEIGPSPWRVGIAVTVEVGLGALAGAAAVRRFSP